jgi:DNA-binding CsgD family transcriptional regulator
MNRHTVVYGLLGGALIALLKVIEYRYLVVEHSLELYGGLVAIVFAAVGVWLGGKVARVAHPAQASHPPPALGTLDPQATVLPNGPTREDRDASQAGASAAIDSPEAQFVADRAGIEALRITKRELEILALMAEGLSNREIAGQIFVSENTVKTHTSRLFEKLQARRRTQAVQIGKQRGLIP